MKLRNKKTGEIAEFIVHKRIEDSKDGNQVYEPFVINPEEWEDVSEEPKDFWHIDDFAIMCGTEGEFTIPDLGSFTKRDIKRLKEIGNYFETKEEAEKAVEKLKAWKRLKDKGFKFEGWDNTERSTIHNFSLFVAIEDLESISKDLDLLFGGEE